MKDPHVYARELVTRALSAEFPDTALDSLATLAEGFLAIASEQEPQVSVETLLVWVHSQARDKEWTLAEWRAFCRVWRTQQLELAGAPPQGALFAYTRDGFDPE